MHVLLGRVAPAARTKRMIEVMGIGFLDAVPRMFFAIAVAAW
jgi:hypothetical protein